MLTGFRTFITLFAGWLFDYLTRTGIIQLSSNQVTAEKIETAVMTFIFILAALFRFYANRKLFSKKPK